MADNLDLRGEGGSTGGWLAGLEAQNVRVLILDVRSDGDLLREARTTPGWHLDVYDGESAICVREEG